MPSERDFPLEQRNALISFGRVLTAAAVDDPAIFLFCQLFDDKAYGVYVRCIVSLWTTDFRIICLVPLRGVCLYCHNDAKVYIVGEFLSQRAKKSRATFGLQAGSEEMESGKKVEFVHQVQIFLGVLSSVLDCEDGVFGGSSSMS